MKHYALLFCLLLALSANSFSSKAQVDVNDSLALVDFYNSTNGPGWYYQENWLTKEPVSSWLGITVTGTRVTGISLLSNGLKGSIPSSFGNLIGMESVHLQFNKIGGSIPSSIGNLVNINSLYLHDNKLVGNIPATIGNLKAASYLYLNKNRLNGSIPSSIGNMVELFILDLSNNNFKGVLPASIGNLTFLRYLFLSNNQLTGGIPASFRKLESLYSVNLSRNYLSHSNNEDFPMVVRQDGYANVSYNNSTFNGLEFLAQNVRHPTYAPQAIIPLHQHGNTLAVYAGGTLSNNTYTWFMVGETGSTPITGDSTYTPEQSGKYYVRVTNAVATKLTLYSDTIEYVANSITASKVATLPVSDRITAFYVYPNPARDKLNIQITGKARLTLANQQGQAVLTKVIENTGVIDVSHIPAGVYFLTNITTGALHRIVIGR